MRGCELVAKALKEEGTGVVFTLRGFPLLGLCDALGREGIRVVDARHEQAAVLMAQGYARSTGRPAVAAVTPGPGVLNALTGIANCYYGSAPVIVLAGRPKLEEADLGAFHEMDHLALVRPITKWCAMAYEARRAGEYVGAAFREAASGMPGPAFVDLPEEVLEEEVGGGQAPLPQGPRTTARPLGDPREVARAVTLLAEAKRPLLVYGSGVLWSGAHEELRAFAEEAKIPTVPTPLARGCVPDDHAFSCFAARSRAMAGADVVLFVGARLNFILGFGRPPRFHGEVRAIQVDVCPAEIGRNRIIDVGIVGDAKAVLGQLLEEWRRAGASSAGVPWAAELKEVEAKKARQWEPRALSGAKPIDPARLCHEISRFLSRDAILCVDGGGILDVARNVIPAYEPGGQMNPGATGLIGVGIPYAIAAKLAHPAKQVLCLCGDVAFGLCGMELDTAARLAAPIVVVVSNNAGWGPAGGEPSPGGASLAITLARSRYDLVAQGLGCHGETVEEPGELRAALERAFAAGRPALVNAITGESR